MKSKLFYRCATVGLLGGLFLFSACGADKNGQQNRPKDPSTDAPAEGDTQNETNPPEADSGGAQMANPASVHCKENGGQLELMDDENGQFGVCIFNDGSRCEEWRFFRKECAPGQCREQTGICDKTNSEKPAE